MRAALAAGVGGRRVGLTPRGVVLVLVVFLLAVTAVYPLREHVSQQARIRQLQAKQAALDAANAQLAAERARLKDPAYLEQLAKQNLNVVRPGEQQWEITGTPPAAKPPPAPKPPPKPPWYTRFWRWLTGTSH
ncbi:MAG TPA: septum formation initiator family protein [Actinomycetota bacterium]